MSQRIVPKLASNFMYRPCKTLLGLYRLFPLAFDVNRVFENDTKL